MSGLKKKGPARRPQKSRRGPETENQRPLRRSRPARRFPHMDDYDEYDEFYD